MRFPMLLDIGHGGNLIEVDLSTGMPIWIRVYGRTDGPGSAFRKSRIRISIWKKVRSGSVFSKMVGSRSRQDILIQIPYKIEIFSQHIDPSYI